LAFEVDVWRINFMLERLQSLVAVQVYGIYTPNVNFKSLFTALVNTCLVVNLLS
jgi:hypothetical protein